MTHKEVIVGAVGYDALKTKIDALASACATRRLLSPAAGGGAFPLPGNLL